MNTLYLASLTACRRFTLPAVFILSFVPTWCTAQIDTGLWKSKTKGPAHELSVYFPPPNQSSGSPELLVVPLLGPNSVLLPGGRLSVWVGRNDGTPLPNATVTMRVPAHGNTLVSGNARVAEITVQTNAQGIADVVVTAPDLPPDEGGGGSGGGDLPAT